MASLKLSEELRSALTSSEVPVAVQDSETKRIYYLVEDDLYERAMEALYQQDEVAAIQSGIDDMEAGRVLPFEDVDAQIRARLGMPTRT
ncbi:MAG: hypothetical protein CMJ78_08335 [Planctomycetaceae bacterium]|nr:hypothetical protein [Planctomycetaceae bacterium]